MKPSEYTDKLKAHIAVGIENRLKRRGLQDSTDPVAVQAVCDQFAAEINTMFETDLPEIDRKRWALTIKDDIIWIGFEGDPIE